MDQQPAGFTAPHAGGPPPPPWEQRRRRRRRAALAVVLVLAVVGIGVALALPGLRAGDESASAPSTGPDTDEPAEPDAGPDPEPDADEPDASAPESGDLIHPDPDALEGEDAVFGQLLIDIDASERTMITFQDELQAAFGELGVPEDDLIERIRAAAAAGTQGLTSVRERLADQLEPAGAEAVRQIYVDHLDAWVRYMRAVEEEPSLLDPSVDSSHYIVAINASAGAFARALEEHLPPDVDPSVRDLAEGILDRGFRMEAEPQV